MAKMEGKEMAEYLGTPKVQYFDTDTGDPLEGGKLYTYDSDFVTPRATYPTLADAAAGTNANTNPVILDARGEANVVISGSTGLILKRADDTTIWTAGPVGATGSNIYDPSGNEILILSYVADAVNEVTITNAATGDAPTILTTGGDSNINLIVHGKGTGGIDIGTKLIDANENEILTLTAVASAANYIDITNCISDSDPAITAAGSDANIGLQILPKGSGVIQLGLIKHPTAVGTAGQYVTLSGTDTLQFTTLPVQTGSIIQTISTFKSDIFSTASPGSPVLITGMQVSITPSSTSNKIRVDVSMTYATSVADSQLFFYVVRGATIIGGGDASGAKATPSFGGQTRGTNSTLITTSWHFYDSPSSIASTTYSVQVAAPDGAVTFYLNKSPLDSNTSAFGRTGSSISVSEIKV